MEPQGAGACWGASSQAWELSGCQERSGTSWLVGQGRVFSVSPTQLLWPFLVEAEHLGLRAGGGGQGTAGSVCFPGSTNCTSWTSWSRWRPMMLRCYAWSTPSRRQVSLWWGHSLPGRATRVSSWCLVGLWMTARAPAFNKNSCCQAPGPGWLGLLKATPSRQDLTCLPWSPAPQAAQAKEVKVNE